MYKYLFIVVGMIFISERIKAQGCSDAGFCSLKYHNIADQKDTTQKKNSISLGNVSGIGDGNTFENGTWLTYSRQIGKRFFADTKITTNYASGSIANNFNIGDVFVNLSYEATKHQYNQSSLKLLAGLKIPLTAGNDKAGGKPLPMTFQSSLGTFDALLGINYSIKKFEFTNAYQIPITKQNKNTYLKEYSVTDDFPSTNNFERKADVLLRAAYNFNKIGKHIYLKPNLLAIYHVGEDSYENIFGQRQNLKGSDGLTLNANVIANYTINALSSFGISLATPFIVRDIRPDGLTREFTIAIEYKISF